MTQDELEVLRALTQWGYTMLASDLHRLAFERALEKAADVLTEHGISIDPSEANPC
jgi:hypothetical protein